MSTTIRPHDVCLLVRHLEKHAIVPLVWGEAACLAAYGSRLVPGRLFFIVKDGRFEETKQLLEDLGLKRKHDFNLYEETALPLSHPYVRYALNGAGLASEPYVQIFKASDVGLEGSDAWTSAVAGRVDGGPFLVPNILHYLLVAAALYSKVIETREEYFGWQCSGALGWIMYLLSEALEHVPKDPRLPNNLPKTREIEMVWILYQNLPRKADQIGKRLGFSTRRKDWQPKSQNVWIQGEL